jgi:haloalkane dehalogenase
MYREFLRELRSGFRCIALDYPGFGLSQAAAEFRYTLPELRSIVETFVETLDLKDITLFVHDAGGPIGLGAAARKPERYKAFVISDTFAFPLKDYPLMRSMLGVVTSGPFRFLNRRFNLMARVISRFAPVRRRLSKEERGVYRHLFPTPEARDRSLALMNQLRTQYGYLQQLEDGIRHELQDRPALLMFGQFDPARLAGWMRRFETLFRQHCSRPIPWEGHFPHEGSPATMIAEFQHWYGSISTQQKIDSESQTHTSRTAAH